MLATKGKNYLISYIKYWLRRSEQILEGSLRINESDTLFSYWPWPNDSVFHSTFTQQKFEGKIEPFGHLVEWADWS